MMVSSLKLTDTFKRHISSEGQFTRSANRGTAKLDAAGINEVCIQDKNKLAGSLITLSSYLFLPVWQVETPELKSMILHCS